MDIVVVRVEKYRATMSSQLMTALEARVEAPARSPIQGYLEELYVDCVGESSGEVASYIPELAWADPDWF